MAQYKHRRLTGLKTLNSGINDKSFGRTMLTVIFVLLLMLLVVGFLSIGISFTNDTEPVAITEDGTIFLSDDLALDDAQSSHVTDGWTFVPNISPDIAEYTLGQAVLYADEEDENYWPSSALLKRRPYADDVRISDTWRGWFDYHYSANWHNSGGNIQYQRFPIENNELHTAAYIGHFRCSEDVKSLSLTFHKCNGTAWIYCNGNFVDCIGDKTPVFNYYAFADYATLIPDNGRIDLVIVVACSPVVTNPGLLSEPIIETSTSNDIRTGLTAGHFAVVTVLFTVTIAVGSNIILGSTKNRWLFLSFFISFVTILFYYLTDCRFLSVNSRVRADIKYVLLIVASAAGFIQNSQFFAGTKTRRKYALLRDGHYFVCTVGIALIIAYFICESSLNVQLPEFIAIMYALAAVTLAIFIDLFFYYNENQTSLLWALLFCTMFFILDLTILMNGMFTYLVPTYSNVFVIFSIIAEIAIVSSYINQQREIKKNAAVLKRQVREKTVYISEINRDLVLTNKKLMEGEVARKNVLSNVSHDLRTPITAIRGYAELLLSSQDNFSPEQRNNYLSNIVRRSEQMERIVSDIMELTRMESSDSDFHFTSVSISEMLDELVVMFSMDLEETSKHLSLDLQPRDPLIVRADPAKLSRVFENLISNAINYTTEDADIKIKAWRTGDAEHVADQKIHITVEDNGIGIPEDEVSRVFDRFYRAHNSGVNIKGTGLGLAIVKLICDKHEADISVVSKLGQGTTFEVVMAASY
ncbi:MAG: MFS domain-containing histidine kinase [Saccharofermentans sp.]|nr:MFS domain-containing histidine kinase [Saccharofermentans sp.]